MTPGALDGIVVADFTRVLAGPYCTMLLADLGAEVTKIERPGTGDDTRHWGPPFDDEGRATYFESVNRNKRSIALDLNDPADRQRARAMALGADVVVENFAPGTMARFGLDYDSLAAEQPGLVYCSITGFGDAAGAELPGYDLLVQAVGGLMSITGPAPGQPTKTGVAVVDVLTGLHATVGILAALRHRDATGAGQRVDVTLLTSLLSALVNQSASYLIADTVPGILGNAHPSIAPYESFATEDRPIVIAVGNDRQFGRLAAALGLPELIGDERFQHNAARVAHREELRRLLEDRLCTAPAADWLDALAAGGIPAGPINTIDEAVALADSLGLHPVVEIEDPGRSTPSRQIAHPIRLSTTPPRYELAPPALPGSDDT